MSNRVRIYRNLHTRNWSVQHKVPGKGWRVSHHADRVVLLDVEFKISEAGRQRVRKERKKNVHAFAEGILHTDGVLVESAFDWFRVSYNPYTNDGFSAVPRDRWSPSNIVYASAAVFDTSGMMYVEEEGAVGQQRTIQKSVDSNMFIGYTTNHE